MTGDIPELATNPKFGRFGGGGRQSFGLYGESFPGMSSSGMGDFFSRGSRRNQEIIPDGVKDLKDTRGIKGLNEQSQTSQLGGLRGLKGERDFEGVGKLSETK